jgi:hypothetical protein
MIEEPKKDYGLKADGTPRQRSNQWVKNRERMERFHNAEEHRNKIKVGMIMAEMHRAALGKKELKDGQVAAAKLLLDKAMPTLQAVEQTNIEPAATRSEAELLSELKAILAANPDLAQQALAELAKESNTPVKVA